MRLHRLATLAVFAVVVGGLALPSLADADAAAFDRFRGSRGEQPRAVPAAQCSAQRPRQAPAGELALAAVREALAARRRKVADAPPASPGVLLNSRGYNYGAAPGIGLEMRHAELDAGGR